MKSDRKTLHTGEGSVLLDMARGFAEAERKYHELTRRPARTAEDVSALTNAHSEQTGAALACVGFLCAALGVKRVWSDAPETLPAEDRP
jgi:hypothetical protein